MTECWVITDGTAGNENPARGLAEAVAARLGDMEIALRHVDPQGLWRRLPPQAWMCRYSRADGFPFSTLPTGARLASPWPDLVIGNGRLSVPFSAAIRQLAGAATTIVQLQSPRIASRYFDLVIAPEHDAVTGANVLAVTGSLSSLGLQQIEDAAIAWRSRFDEIPHPRVAVLIGGTSKAHQMTPRSVSDLCDQLELLVKKGTGLMVTLSRRTGEDMADRIRDRLLPLGAYIWDGTGDNPYAALLGLADAIVVTEDTVNMACEAAMTGKPVHMAALEGGSAKLNRFHGDLTSRGITRPFIGQLVDWNYTPLRETDRAADIVCDMILQKRPGHKGPGKSRVC